jgi:hypothetical protein
MGLDMYAFRVKAEDVIDDFTVRNPEQGREGDLEELAYWRKHHDLHGWMERLYRSKGGTKESFNCIPLRLTKTDLDLLEHDVLNNTLPETQGFFFGTNPPDEYSQEQDMTFIMKAKIAISAGDAVYYDSWW